MGRRAEIPPQIDLGNVLSALPEAQCDGYFPVTGTLLHSPCGGSARPCLSLVKGRVGPDRTKRER